MEKRPGGFDGKSLWYARCAVERRFFLVGANPTQYLSFQLVATKAVYGGDDMD